MALDQVSFDTPSRWDEFEWSTVDISRHERMCSHAETLLPRVHDAVSRFDAILEDFAAACRRSEMDLRWERDPDALVWHLTLTGCGFRANGDVEIAIETARTVSVISRPDGEPALTLQAIDGLENDLRDVLAAQFRTAAIASVLDAATVLAA